MLIDLLDDDSDDWDPPTKTAMVLGKMNALHRHKITAAEATGRPVAGTIYQRTRRDTAGRKVQRSEVRFDGIAGCLRTPAGGSSIQVVVVVNGSDIRTRRMSAPETARLMGLPKTYALPTSYYESYQLTGDGVVVPVVRFLGAHVLEHIGRTGRRSDPPRPATGTPAQRRLELR